MNFVLKFYKEISKSIIFKLISILLVVIFIESVLYTGISYYNLFQPITSDRVTYSAREIFEACSAERGSKEQCYAKAFYNLTQKNPMSYSASVLDELQVIDPKNAIGCHFISHKISQAETEKDPSRWKELLGELNFNKCTGGFLHGVIEAHLAKDPDFTINIESADLICNQIVSDPQSRRSCFHIMGHLLLFQNNANLMKAVDSCKPFEEGMPKYECLSGAFMENLTREYLVAHGITEKLPWNLDNTKKIEKLCGEYDGLAQKACWKEISYMYWSVYATDQNKLFEACNRAPKEDMATDCFIYGAGNMITSYRFNMKRLPEVCSVYDYSDIRYKSCTRQLIGSLLNTSVKNLNNSMYLCSELKKEVQPFCFNSIIQVLTVNNMGQSQVEYVCKNKPKEILSNSCKQS